MCGIAGFVLRSPDEFRGRNRPEKILDRMTQSLTHRGPDDCGTEVFPPRGERTHSTGNVGSGPVVGMGNTRLSILDLSAAGHQPMTKEQAGNTIVFNGEIYNFRSLRRDLETESESIDWQSETDTETILQAYDVWGEDCLQHLRGMFAFGIWDRKQEQLFLARDRLGIKPLYYYSDDNLFLFASEIRAILSSGLVSRRLNSLALRDYLTYQSVHPPRTLVEGIRMLPPGRWMRVDSAGNHEAGQYWNLWNASEDVPIKPGENGTQDLLLDLLEESMELHLVSDVPVGLFLSGGIDSSALVSLMERLGRTPRTFNVSFKESAFDEGKYARLVADRFQTDHTEITLHEQDLLDQLPEALASMDRPTGDGLNTYVISRAVRQEGLKVALSGLGGDELFGGYPSFKRLYRWRRLLETWGRMPGGIRRKLADVVQRFSGMSSRGTKLAELIAGDGSLARSFPVFRQVLSPRQWKGLLDSSWLKNAGSWEDPCVELLSETFGERVKEGRFLRAVSFAEMRTYMHDVLLTDTDQMSMAHSLEIRVPLLDHKLVEFVTALPDSRKPVHGTPKQLLVETLRPSLPDAVVDRPKQGFVLPMNRWMQEGLRAFCQKHLQSDRLGARAFMDAGALESLWERYLSHPDRVQWSRIWTLVVLENWLERHDIIV